ncbi:MAG: hypothetical protein ACI8Z1_001461 [Candidatus Azotimanducaceae bacterium]|jgi:hypothetical protein
MFKGHQNSRESFEKAVMLSPLTTRTICRVQRSKNEPPGPRQVIFGFDLTDNGEIQPLEVLASTGNNVEAWEASKRLKRMIFRPQLKALKFVGSEGLKINIRFEY